MDQSSQVAGDGSGSRDVFSAGMDVFAVLGDRIKDMSIHQSDPDKQLFQIPHRTIFIYALESLGIRNAKFTDLRSGGCFQVQIQFSSDLPVCIDRGSNYAIIAGDVCSTHEIAEASAVTKAFAHLSKVHNVVLVDITSRKKSAMESSGKNLYRNVSDGLTMVQFMLEKWNKCLDSHLEVQNFALPKMRDAVPLESAFAVSVFKALQRSRDVALHSIRYFEHKLKRLRDEKDKYAEACRRPRSSVPKSFIKKAYFHEVDALAIFLQWLGLEGGQYSAILCDDGLFLGSVRLSFPGNQEKFPQGEVKIEAKQLKTNVAKAHNAAAREAIYFLELHYNVEVLGMEPHESVVAEQQLFVWKGINDEMILLGSDVLKSWEDMLKQIDHSIGLHKNRSAVIVSCTGVQDEIVFISELVRRLEVAAANCADIFKKVAAKFVALK